MGLEMEISIDPLTGEAAADPNGEGVGSPSPESRFRAGQRVLTLLATPLNFMILRALAEQPMRLADLRQATGLSAQTTLRGHLANLSEIGVLDKRPTSQMPYAVENELTDLGHDLLDVADRLECWLNQAPQGPISLETGAAKGVVKAFVDGWGSTIMADLATRPMSLTELDRRIADLSYPALERRLSSMRLAGLIEPRPADSAGTPYAVTEWARLGVVPLATATRCERVHLARRAPPLTHGDIEAAFMLALPLVGMPPDVAGSCQLQVEADAVVGERAGVRVEIERGKVVACASGFTSNAGAFAIGSASTWFVAIKDGKAELLSTDGSQLAEGLVIALHSALAME
jgi:DNA-binding HxlR family transcriptional regulator